MLAPPDASFDTPGILTRSADDAAFAVEHLDAERVPDLGAGTALRIGVAGRFFWRGRDPDISQRITEAPRLMVVCNSTNTGDPIRN